MDMFIGAIGAAGVGLLLITIVALVGGLIWFATTRRRAAAVPADDDPLEDLIGAADNENPVTSFMGRDRRGNRVRFRRQAAPAQPAPALAVIAAGPGAPTAPIAWWPWTPPTPPAPGATLTMTVNETIPAPAGGGPGTFAINITGATGAVTFWVTGLPGGMTWAVVPAGFTAPGNANLILNYPAGAPRGVRATLIAVVGGNTTSCEFLT